jgi:Mg2+ and Co2+ transporter CorA
MTNEEFQKEVIILLKDIKSNTNNYDKSEKLLEYLKDIKDNIESLKEDVDVIRKELNNR